MATTGDTLFYRQQGDSKKTAVLLLHSGGMTGAEWSPQFPELAKHFRVIAPDLPGHGQSPMLEQPGSIGAHGRAVVQLMDTLAIDRASLVGSSMGGATALWITVHHPDRVAKLALFRAGYRKDEASFSGTREMADPEYWRRLGLQRLMSEQHLPQGGPEAWHTVIRRVMQAHDPATSDHCHSLATLAGIGQPVLVVGGDRDPLVPLDHLLELYTALPDAGLWVLPYSTHVAATNTWRSESFTVELVRFLGNRGIVKTGQSR